MLGIHSSSSQVYYIKTSHHHPSLYFLGASLLGHTPAVQYSTVDCTVGGSKESRGSTVTLYVYPAACGGYVGASSSRVAFRAIGVEVSCFAAAGLSGCRADDIFHSYCTIELFEVTYRS